MNRRNLLTIGLQLATKHSPAWRAVTIRSLVASGLCALANLQSQAATITWTTPVTISSDTDVNTLGSLDRAYDMVGGAVTINGVSFTSWTGGGTAPDGKTTINFAGLNSAGGTSFSGSAAPFTGLSANYQTLLETGYYENTGSAADNITLNSLTVGTKYLVQYWVNDSRSIGARTLTLDGNVKLSYPANANGAVGQYSVGYFTADSTSQTITIFSTSSAQVNALQVRTVTSGSPQDIKKLNNTTALNATGSWNGSTVPGSLDRGWWESTAATGSSVALGGNLSWAGILYQNPGGAWTISSGSTLTLGGAGIDMSAASQNFTINCAVSLGVNQRWQVASGKTLAIGGAVSGSSSPTFMGPGNFTIEHSPHLQRFDRIAGTTLGYSAGTVLPTGTVLVMNGGRLDFLSGSTADDKITSMTVNPGASARSPTTGGGGGGYLDTLDPDPQRRRHD